MSKHYDPEQEAYDRGVFISVRDDLPGNVVGLTDCETGIWVHRDLLQRERRSTLAHEVEHVDIYTEQPGRMGANGRWYGRSVETECNERASVKLIDFDDLVEACKWADSLEEAADELVVTDDMVRARLHTLTKDEVKRFDREVGRGYAARLRGKPLRRTGALKRRR